MKIFSNLKIRVTRMPVCVCVCVCMCVCTVRTRELETDEIETRAEISPMDSTVCSGALARACVSLNHCLRVTFSCQISSEMYFLKLPLRVLVKSTSWVGRSGRFIEGNWPYLTQRFAEIFPSTQKIIHTPWGVNAS